MLERPGVNPAQFRVKGDPATSLLPIVIVTGESEFDAKMQAWDVGADDFLTKPFQVVEVLARCRSLLRTKQLVDELDSAQSVLFAFARTLEAKVHRAGKLKFHARLQHLVEVDFGMERKGLR